MTNKSTDLSRFDNSDFNPGNPLKRGIWYLVNVMFFLNPFFPFSGFKRGLLRMFGAKVGKGVVIKPRVNIKYPWYLEIGDYSWIGEQVWIDNLASVKIGKHCCLSQGSMMLCGNHNYKKSTFDLITGKIYLEDGVWIGAHSVVCPSVTCSTHSVLAVNSVATSNLDPNGIYQGNPAVKVKERVID
jgi:putative colanic acid biosynthesis acetyltransferase WcaF